jgi:methanol--5-hydroxybenzimidazolylcobamide Co-methyltransferase
MSATPTARQFSSLAASTAEDLIFGTAPNPVRCGFDLEIGSGKVFPEVNFTLPAIEVSAVNWDEILTQYDEIATAILRRGVALRVPGIVLEFELLPAMTEKPEWGAAITELLHRKLADAHSKHGLPSALRVTPTDIREKNKPPALRNGEAVATLLRSFELCADAGADILSIESVGGKEVHDQALMYGDVKAIVFALGVLAPRDVSWLWSRIRAICDTRKSIAGGDTACGFANTAMQLAHQRMLPEVLAAVIRAMSAVRSLAAFEQGAVGPSKDCAYEGPVLKAITGCPISMEGKSAVCAHFSPLGNIASAMCDLWSNESVQNVRLLSGSAPEAFTEALVYDCRLMNVAIQEGGAIQLRDWLCRSDSDLSPQAAILTPSATLRIANAIVAAADPYTRTVDAGKAALAILHEALAGGKLTVSKKEQQWLDRLDREFAELPATADALLAQLEPQYANLYDPSSYGMHAPANLTAN